MMFNHLVQLTDELDTQLRTFIDRVDGEDAPYPLPFKHDLWTQFNLEEEWIQASGIDELCEHEITVIDTLQDPCPVCVVYPTKVVSMSIEVAQLITAQPFGNSSSGT